MGRGGRLARVGVFAALVVGLGPAMAPVRAQEGTPGAVPGATPGASGAAVSVAASGLVYPRGFIWGPDGAMYVALAGTGDDSALAEAPAVVRIEGGCGAPAVRGLPSTRDAYGDHQGPVDVGFLGEQLYVLQDAAGTIADVGVNSPNGLYAANAEGGVRLVGDVTAYAAANPPENVYHLLPLAEPFAMVGDTDGFWVVDANRGELLRITPDGTVSRFADLSLNHSVPTAIALAPGGGVYAGFFGAAPHADDTSKIVKVTADGTATDVWTGLTAVTGLAVGPDGALYAAEMATGNTTEPPYVVPGSGRVVRQTGPGTQAEVVTGLDFPIAMAFGPDGGLYVGGPAFGGADDGGEILRFELGGAEPVVVDPARLPVPACAPAGTPEAVAAGATPAMGMTETAGSPEAGASPVAPSDGKGATGALPVAIVEFAFAPGELAVPRGTTVVWTNLDSVPHTVTATEPGGAGFNSGNIDPGGSFGFRFEEPGVYPYACLYHPNMTGTVVVE